MAVGKQRNHTDSKCSELAKALVKKWKASVGELKLLFESIELEINIGYSLLQVHDSLVNGGGQR